MNRRTLEGFLVYIAAPLGFWWLLFFIVARWIG